MCTFKKHIIIGILACLPLGKLFAQNDVLLTQQWLSRININPAATGNSDNIDVFVLMRQQWQGFDNAPETQVLNIHNYFDRIHSGLGLTASHDKIGVGNRIIDAKIAYAYHINLGETWLLSMGLSGGVQQRVYDPSEQFFIDGNDPEIPYEKQSKISPDFDFGVEFSSNRFLFGASVTHLLRMPDKETTLQQGQQYYAYASYKQPLGSSVELTPAIRGSNFDQKYFLDFSLTAMFFKKVWIGAAFRPDNAAAGFAGVQISFFRLGYAYDYSIGETANLAKNSHEIMVSLKIGKPKKIINTKSPRFIEN